MWILLLAACAPSPPDSGTPATGSPASSPLSGTPAGTVATSTWDPSPLEAPRGTIARFEVQCGLLQGAPVREFRKLEDDGDRWQMLFPDQPDVIAAIQVCTTPTENYLDWLPDGRLEILASDLWHEMDPTAQESRWLGTTWPLSGSSPECDAVLADLALSWPVTLTMELVEVVPPDTTP